ncbi:MAG: hypothetical protein JW779_14145 [Candidatus Thorarchaeota archaeon]|nr:hypothetical protein [Candidatus Thorarchaeota archaeon]
MIERKMAAWTSTDLIKADRRTGCSCIGATIALVVIAVIIVIMMSL